MNTKVETRNPHNLSRSSLGLAEADHEGLKEVLKYHIDKIPGVLSDVEITQLCTLPDRYTAQIAVDEGMRRFQFANPEMNTWPPLPDNVAKINEEHERLKILHTHDVTPGMRAAFVPMISDFKPELIREVDGRKIISKGLTSFGYDVSIREDFKLFTNVNAGVIDPKKGGEDCLVDAKIYTDDTGARYVILPPNSYILGVTHEYFTIPRDVMVICVGKSTYARAGAIVNTTPIEPGFEGNVVIEIANATSAPMKIYVDEGISQFVFFRGNRECKTSYADRQGKYQKQTGVTLGKV